MRGRSEREDPAIAALLAEVYADPESDAPRTILADVLQQEGDPRGEFIALQLQARRTRRSERRMAKLLERHSDEFLGPLKSVVMPTPELRWERGFVSEASVVLEGLHVDLPALATLRSLEVLFSPAAPLELASVHMKSLRDVRMAAVSAVPVLFDGPRTLDVQHVGLSGAGDLATWADDLTDQIGRARTLPKLERLTLRSNRSNFADASWIWRLPVLPSLRSLLFDGSFRGVPLRDLLPTLRSIAKPPAAVEFHGVGITLRVRAADGFRSLQAELDPPAGVVIFVAMLDALPPDALDDLSITARSKLEPALIGTLRLAARRLKLTNLELPSGRSSTEPRLNR